MIFLEEEEIERKLARLERLEEALFWIAVNGIRGDGMKMAIAASAALAGKPVPEIDGGDDE